MVELAQTPRQIAPNASFCLLDQILKTGELPALHRPIPAPEPDPEPNPGPDALDRNACGNVSATDWDSLFDAVQRRLENCVSDVLAASPNGSAQALQDRHEATKTLVLECVEAMKQLHAELLAERRESQKSQSFEPTQQH